MKKKILLLFATVLMVSLAIGTSAVVAGTSGQYKVANNTRSYVVQAVTSEGLWLFNLDPAGNLRRLDVPIGETYQGHAPPNMIVNFWAWRSDKGDVWLGAAQIGCFDLGELKVFVTENGGGKPVIAFSGASCWQTILAWPQ